jgi:signal transduction histidine kinase
MRTVLVRYPQFCVVILIMVTSLIFISGIRYYAEEAKRQVAYDKAEAILEAIIGLHTYYSNTIVPRIEANGGVFEMRFHNNLESFPYPAGVAADFGSSLQAINPDMDTSIYSNDPFPIREDRVLDEFERESLAALERNPEEDYAQFVIKDGVELIRYARAMHMDADCVACHNRPEFEFEGRWEVDQFRGARQVSLPIPIMTPIVDAATNVSLVVAVIASIVGGLIALPVVNGLNQSLAATRALAEERKDLAATLDQKNKNLEAQRRSRSQLIAGISHDLRSPLSAILGFSDILRGRVPGANKPEMRATYAEYINESGHHLQGLIEQILEVSANEAHDWKPRDVEIDLPTLIQSVRPILESSLSAAGMSLSTSIGSTLPLLRADDRAVRRLLTNLADNAAKYSGGSTMTIEATLDGSNRITITLLDDGTGIDTAKLSACRQLGETTDIAFDQQESGLGLGLWLVDLLMMAHGGEAHLDQAPYGHGLAVSLVFPSDRTI